MIYFAGTDFSHLTSDELIKGIKALDLPDYIRSKAYGIDVRETLAQMTEMTIQLGVNMGLSPDDALNWARKLQETVSQSDFDSWVATLLDGGPSIFMNTLSELQTTYPNGAAGVALVRETDPAKIYVWNGTAWEDFGDYQGIEIKDGTVTSEKIAKGAVTPRETTFIETSSNLFNKDSVIKNKNISEVTGEIGEFSNRSVSDYISVNPSSTYYTANVEKVVRFDENKQVINGHFPEITGSLWTTTPETHFVRVQLLTADLDIAQMNESEAKPYEPYYVRLKDDIAVELKKGSVETEHISDKAVKIEQMDITQANENLFDKNNALPFSVNDETGELVDHSSAVTSRLIELKQKTLISQDVLKIARYDENKKFLSVVFTNVNDNETYTLSENTSFIRVVVYRDKMDTALINYGNELLPFEQGVNALDRKINVTKLTPKGKWLEDRFIIEGELTGNVSKKEYPATNLTQIKSADFIALYDDLANNYPHYVKKTALGLDDDGNTLYRYDFKPEPVPTVYVSNEQVNTVFPKIQLVSGHHGEKTGIYTMYLALKRICEDWQDDPLLETLRWNVHFIVIPVVNYYGVDNKQRKDSAGVDLARNYPVNWYRNFPYNDDPTSNIYGGTSPLSRKATQLTFNVMKSEKENSIMYVSFHNFYDINNFIWIPASTKLQVTLARTLISKMTRKWKKEHPDIIPQDETSYVGYTRGEIALGGDEGQTASSLGIQAVTYEISEKLKYEPGTPANSSLVLTLGTEAFLNYLVITLRENTKFYNQYM